MKQTIQFYEEKDFIKFQKSVPNELSRYIFGNDYFDIPQTKDGLVNRTIRLENLTVFYNTDKEFDDMIKNDVERIREAEKRIERYKKAQNILKSSNTMKDAFEAIIELL